MAVNLRTSFLALLLLCTARIAHADAPSVDGELALGVRASSTGEAHYDVVDDDTSSTRWAADGLIGLRFGRALVGLHAGIATPLRFFSSPLYDSGEQVATTHSTIHPIDLGAGAQYEVGAGFWISGWLGATVAITDADSPAAHISSIDGEGDIPARSWRTTTTSLGYGAAFGYDVVRNQYGRLAAVVAVESQGIGEIPLRDNGGGIGTTGEARTCRSITFGVAYRY
jgi:hypothetical protein